MPDLGTLDLQDQHIVVVVVGSQPPLPWRGDVGVHLYREVQLDLDRASQRPHRPHVLLNAVQNNRVTLGKVVADTDEIKAAINKPIAVGALFVFSPYQPHRRWLVAKQLQQLVDRRRSRQESIEKARAASLYVVVVHRPYFVKKGLDGQRLKQSGERELGANARRALPHQSCSSASPAWSAFQAPGSIGIAGPPPNSSPASVVKPNAAATGSLRTVPGNPNAPAP